MASRLLGVVEKLHDRLGVRRHVAARKIGSGLSGRNPRLFEVERDDGQPEGHVFHGLVHCRDVVERVLRVWRKSDRGGGEYVEDRLVWNPARQLQVIL